MIESNSKNPTHIVPRFATQCYVYSLKVFIFRLHLKHKQCRRLWLNQIASTIYPKWPCSATVTQAIWYQGKSALLWCFLTSYTISSDNVGPHHLFEESLWGINFPKSENWTNRTKCRRSKISCKLASTPKVKKERKGLLNLKLNVTSCMTISVECFSKIFSSHHYQGDHTGAGCHICIIHCHRELWHNKTGRKKN